MLDNRRKKLFEDIDEILKDNMFHHSYTLNSYEHYYHDGYGNEVFFDPENEEFIITGNTKSFKQDIDNLGTLNICTVSQLLIQFGIK